ncbi:hypothetical protein EVC02_009 [Rhizobium phage RHph_N17]|nr:hypothetical protein EVC02_009 [Rhizobium phage RHph_N17]
MSTQTNIERMQRKLAARNYEVAGERVAFRLGYWRGFNGHEAKGDTTGYRNRFPNAFSAGYWEGVAHAEADEKGA